MGKPLRIGIIGLGFGGTVHLPVFESLPGVKVVAVADSDPQRIDRISSRLGGKKIYLDWKQLVEDKNIDAVTVATPPLLQKKIVCAAISRSKHVLCEKPFGKNIKEAEAMYKTAKKSRLINAVDFQYRMEPGIESLGQQMRKSILGKIRRIDVAWLTGSASNLPRIWTWRNNADCAGGVLVGYGCHVIDYLQWMCKSQIKQVFACSHILNPYLKDSFGKKRKVTAEDSIDFVGEFSNGIVANVKISNCFMFGLGHRIEVYGDQGRLMYLHEKPFTPEKMSLKRETKAGRIDPIRLDPNKLSACADSRSLAFRKLACLFIDAINGNDSPDLPSFDCGLKVQEVIEAIKKSVDTKTFVAVNMSH